MFWSPWMTVTPPPALMTSLPAFFLPNMRLNHFPLARAAPMIPNHSIRSSWPESSRNPSPFGHFGI